MRNNKRLFAWVLIAFGALLLLNRFGMGFYWSGADLDSATAQLMSYVIPALMVALGWYGVKYGGSFIAWVVFIVGLVILFGKLASLLLGVVVGIVLIAYGIHLLGRPRRR